MYAVIVTGGKQYKVSEGDVIEVEKLEGEAGTQVEFTALMVVDGENVTVGADVKATVTGEIVKQGKTKKIVVFKYKPKKNERKKNGHRQAFTKVKITKIA
ncbi:MAG: 50S ribosomal protein L21 [Clostridia bacterium]|nr:50S ribosomal protein L21 [Clostridia bacterium]